MPVPEPVLSVDLQGVTLSVVVETINAREEPNGSLADDLRATFDGLAQQTVAPDEVIIVIDDLVDPAAADELRHRYPYAKLTTSGRSNYFAAKNAGAEAASGEIVAMLDSDCVPAADWIEMLLARFSPGVDGVAGRSRYPTGSLLARTFSVPDLGYVVERNDGTASIMNLSNVAFRRDVLLQHPLDSRIRRHGGGYFLLHQLRAAGARIVYEARARVWHGFPGGVGIITKHFIRGHDGVGIFRLDHHCILRGTRVFRRFGAIALVGITGRRIVLDWLLLTRQYRQIGIPAFSVPYWCAITVGTRLIELVGGLVAIAAPGHNTGTAEP
ncbi:MAG: glycosyltransferase [Acidobacteria bacterium]|nr:glycosyltransferase [Acidobacteriota bacterium]MBV9186402.1 glycosyltransferase [Acidobacteriota bacterium]